MMKVYPITRSSSYNYYFMLAFMLIALLVSACSKSSNSPTTNNTTKLDVRQVEMLLPGSDEPITVTYKVVDGYAMFEHDIILGTMEEMEKLSVQGAAIQINANLWPNGVIPYVISGELSSTLRSRINDAISHWESRTTIDFRPRNPNNTQDDYIRFVDGEECSSPVGQTKKIQNIVLANDCGTGTIIHELGHTVGLWHEQSRTDRDKHVRIRFENIQKDQKFNFVNEDNGVKFANDLGPYDYGSIMHYSRHTFCIMKDGGFFDDIHDFFTGDDDCVGPTIETIPAGIPIGQRNGLSAGDIFAVCKLYRELGSPGVLKDFGYGDDAGCWRIESHPRLLGDVDGDGRDDIVGFDEEGVKVSPANSNHFNSPRIWIRDFGYNAGGWRVNKHPRFLADVNGDGKQDVVGFGGAGVLVALSNGRSFDSTTTWTSSYGYNSGYRTEKHPRYLVDVNNDGRDDVVAFANDGTYVSLSNGSNFIIPRRWSPSYGYQNVAGGWTEDYPRLVGDVNGDGRADVVGFSHSSGTVVALSTGRIFTTPETWVAAYDYVAGYRVDKHPRVLADVNGDGKDDVVAFANDGTYVSLSTGSSFNLPQKWIAGYGYNNAYRTDRHIRYVTDINGDGKDDVVAFANDGTFVSLSTGSKFDTPTLWVSNYGYNAGSWRVNRHPRLLGDINKDGKADIVGFGNGGIFFNYSSF